MIHSHLKESACTAIKRDVKFQTSYGYHLSMKGTRKGYLFYQKRYINLKELGIGPLAGVSPHKNLLISPPGSLNDLTYIFKFLEGQH